MEGLDLIPSATSISLAELSEEEQLSLAMKAYIGIFREEQVARVASFIYNRPTGTLLAFFDFSTLHIICSNIIILMLVFL